jgi:amicyanin
MKLTRKSILISTLMVAVLLIVECSKSSSSSGPGPNEVFIQNSAFSPATLTVSVNATVTWSNKDAITHDVTSTTGAFTSGSLNGGATYSFTFTTAGTYNYSCTIHPFMTGKIVVQ